MEVIPVIRERIKRYGIPNAELARRVGMHPEMLRRCLNGTRKLRATELVSLCHELGLKLDDFEKVSA